MHDMEQFRTRLLAMDESELNQLAAFELSKVLGIRWAELSMTCVVATMPVTPIHHQPFGYLHGGVSLVLCETVAGMGGFLNCTPGQAAFGIEINANHLRPVQAGILRAIGTPLLVGRNTQVWEVKVHDEDERLVCASRCTMAMVDLKTGRM